MTDACHDSPEGANGGKYPSHPDGPQKTNNRYPFSVPLAAWAMASSSVTAPALPGRINGATNVKNSKIEQKTKILFLISFLLSTNRPQCI